MTQLSKDAWVIVYLAGGMRSDWQDKVIEACKHERIQFLDPRSHNFEDEMDYTTWDLWAVSQSDYVFAYMEKDNPGGQGLMLEIGFGLTSCASVIFVEDEGDPRTRYYGMARVSSHISFVGLKNAINWFKLRLDTHTEQAADEA